MDKKLLLSVKKPARYINNEINSIKKDLQSVDLKFALVFPDIYEIGMSNVGINILYSILNGRDDIACERIFSPWLDYEKILRENGLKITSLENKLSIDRFDIIGFSLQHDLCQTNVLNILDLGGMALLASERDESAPIILGGGPSCYNPEPYAPFFDAFLIGDGEEGVIEICDTVIDLKKKGLKKRVILERLSAIEGVYVPSFFDVSYHDDGRIKEIVSLKAGYATIKKRVVKDINKVSCPNEQIVPFVRPVHDRYNVEIARGCIRGCRFCHAGYVYRPYRERSCEGILDTVYKGIKSTGCDDVSLLSLSAGDFSFIAELITTLMKNLNDDRISVSLPSIRPGTMDEGLLEEIKKVRKTGFTIAPEAGSERLRRVINKNISSDEILSTADTIFKHGWNKIKMYFMIGLPTETMDDISEIVRLCSRVRDVAKKYNVRPLINVSVSNFVPKGHTPFQFVKQDGEESFREKQLYLKSELRKRNLNYKWHDSRLSILEGVFSRGDRRLAGVIKAAFEMGARFDEWNEVFDSSIWARAFSKCGVDRDFYLRERGVDEVLPYDHIDTMVDKAFLKKEYQLGIEGVYSKPCAEGCKKCGVCDESLRVITNSMFKDASRPPARASDNVTKKKIRFEYTKQNAAAFIGHLDMQTLFIRALNRSGLRCAFSKGYHPMPKLSFGSATPLGLNSLSEFAEVDLIDFITCDEFKDRMNDNLPGGLRIKNASAASFKEKSLFTSITAVRYEVDLTPMREVLNPEKAEKLLDEFNAGDDVILSKIKKGKLKKVNVKEFIESIDLDKDGSTLSVMIKRNEKGELNIFDLLTVLFKMKKDDILAAEVLKIESIIA